MGRTARDNRPYAPPVQKIELNARHTKVRLALALLLFAFGVGAILYALHGSLTVEAGWAEIEAQSTEVSCAGDFTFLYPLGATASPTAERKALTALYSEACATAYRLFTNDAEFDGLANVRYLNAHPNEEVPVDPALYAALAQIVDSGDRSLYLAPICEVCNGIFSCGDPALTADYDPRQNEALRTWCAEVCAYANDPAQVSVELLDDGRAALRVSDEYLAFAKAEEIASFIDFSWMKNAFIADDLAERLTEAGYTAGTLSSCDGFIRNLDAGTETDYALNILAYDGEAPYAAAVLHYRGARAFVTLRDHPATAADAARFALLPDGSYATPYLATVDGLCRSVLSDLTAYSDSLGCAAIALQLIPVYIADELDLAALAALAGSGIDSVYAGDAGLVCTDDSAEFTDVLKSPPQPPAA